MFLVSAYYFVFFAAYACFFPYLSLFYQSIGLTGSQIGLINGITPLISMIFSPLWSGIADAIQRHKAFALIGMLGMIGLSMSLPLIHTFGVLFPVMIAYYIFSAPVMPIIDSNAVATLGEKRDKYGRIRMWGTISFAIMSPLIGQLVQKTSLSWAFWMTAIWFFLGVLIIIPMRIHVDRTTFTILQGIQVLLRNRKWIFFLVMVVISGMGIAISQNYLFIYLKSLNAAESTMGLSLTLSTLGEVPILFFGNRLLKKFGAIKLLHFSLLFTGLRLALSALAPVPWLVILVQILHGFTFPILLIAGIAFCAEIAPPGMRATTQGMFNAVYFGIAYAVGGFVGGILLENVGIKNTFLWGGIFVLVGALIVWTIDMFSKKNEKSKLSIT